MPLYSTTEQARSQARVKQGIANITEQIGFLEKVTAAQRDILSHEAKVIENRLALISMCDNDSSKHVNTYLKKIDFLPPSKTKTNDSIEYVISTGVIIICVGISHLIGESSFSPFFFDWAGYYNKGLNINQA